jgi:hypothetical protein
MNQEKLNSLTNNIDWVKLSLWITVAILSLFLFKSCEGVKELELINKASKETEKRLDSEAQRYVDIANAYRDSVIVLKKLKDPIKDSIVYVTKDVDKKLKKVSTLHAKGIASYFQDLYKIPSTITQYGVAIPDTLGKVIISDLIKGQGYKAQLKFTQKLLTIEEKSGKAKDTIISKLDKAIVKKDSASVVLKDQIKVAEISVRKEKNKKTFWKVATGTAVLVATWLAVKP